jgi:hypothetical protein
MLITDACAALAKSALTAATTAITIANRPTGPRFETSFPCCRIFFPFLSGSLAMATGAIRSTKRRIKGKLRRGEKRNGD